MLSMYNLKTQKKEERNVSEIVKDYNEFKGITFSRSLAILNKMQESFDKIDLIIGIQTNSNVELMKSFLNIERKLKELDKLNEVVKEELVNKNISISYSITKIIHTKLYILTNEEGFCIAMGSANLSKAALTGKNFEMLYVYEGSFSNSEDMEFYNYHIDVFDETKVYTTDYVDDRHLKDYISKNKTVEKVAELYLVENKETLSSLIKEDEEVKQNIIMLNPDIEVENKGEMYKAEFTEKERLEKIVSAISTKSGNIRSDKVYVRNVKSIFSEVDERVAETNLLSDQWIYEETNKTILMGDDPLQTMVTNEVNIEQLEMIIDSYTENKYSDERHQVFTALMYAFTTPYIWKIREIYEENGSRREDVPIAMNIIGVGRSGKTTLIEELFAPLLGVNKVHSYASLQRTPNGKSSPKHARETIDGYYNSEVVKPLILDEVAKNFYTSVKGEEKIKHWSNDISGVHPVIITTSNATSGSFKSQLSRRILYVYLDGELKDAKDCVYSLRDLVNGLSNDLFIEISKKLENRLNNLTEEDLKLLLEDYLYLTKDIFMDIVKNNESNMEFEDFLENYDVVKSRGKSLWASALVSNPNKIFIHPENEDLVIIASSVFKTQKDREDAKAFLPPEVRMVTSGDDFVLDKCKLEDFLSVKMEKLLLNTDYNRIGKAISENISVSIGNSLSKGLEQHLEKVEKVVTTNAVNIESMNNANQTNKINLENKEVSKVEYKEENKEVNSRNSTKKKGLFKRIFNLD